MTQNTTQIDHLLLRIGAGRVGIEALGRSAGNWLLSHVPQKQLVRFIGTHLVAPRLEVCEAALDKFLPGVETAEDRRDRAKMTREQRVDRIARELARQGTDEVGNFFIQVLGQQGFDKLLGVPALMGARPFAVVGADRAAQLGSIVILNTALLNANLGAQEVVAGILQKSFGTPREIAEDKATRLVNSAVPNAIGVLSAVLTHHYITTKLR